MEKLPWSWRLVEFWFCWSRAEPCGPCCRRPSAASHSKDAGSPPPAVVRRFPDRENPMDSEQPVKSEPLRTGTWQTPDEYSRKRLPLISSIVTIVHHFKLFIHGHSIQLKALSKLLLSGIVIEKKHAIYFNLNNIHNRHFKLFIHGNPFQYKSIKIIVIFALILINYI